MGFMERLHRLGLAVLGTYHDRAGEDYMLSAPGNVLQGYQPPEEDEHRLWARAFTSSGKAGDNSSSLPSRHREFQKDGPRYDYDLDGIQLGLDLHRSLDEDGARNIAGAYFAASRMKADVDAIQGGRGGKVSMDGYSLGAYWTHLAPSRWYLDAVGQLTRYDNVRAKASGGETVKPDGWGFAASLEGGYPFQLDEKWSLEPQAQLVYQYVDLGGSRPMTATAGSTSRTPMPCTAVWVPAWPATGKRRTAANTPSGCAPTCGMTSGPRPTPPSPPRTARMPSSCTPGWAAPGARWAPASTPSSGTT